MPHSWNNGGLLLQERERCREGREREGKIGRGKGGDGRKLRGGDPVCIFKFS